MEFYAGVAPVGPAVCDKAGNGLLGVRNDCTFDTGCGGGKVNRNIALTKRGDAVTVGVLRVVIVGAAGAQM